MYSLGANLLVVCAGPGEVSNLGCERRHCSLYHLLVSFGVLRETNLGIFARGNLLLSTSNLPLGVTNEESSHSVSFVPTFWRVLGLSLGWLRFLVRTPYSLVACRS